MKPSTDITDPKVVKALAHSLRVRILMLLDERTMSPRELAEELGARLGNVSYHVRQLASLGLIKLVKRTPRRGAVEHHYRTEPRNQVSDETWAQIPEIVKQAMVGALLGEVGADVSAAAAAGGRGADVEPLPEHARTEFASGRQLASDRRTIARCPACGKAVLAGEDYVRDRGDLYHAGCSRHRGADDGDGRSLLRTSSSQRTRW